MDSEGRIMSYSFTTVMIVTSGCTDRVWGLRAALLALVGNYGHGYPG
jgi:hypothetical protein